MDYKIIDTLNNNINNIWSICYCNNYLICGGKDKNLCVYFIIFILLIDVEIF